MSPEKFAEETDKLRAEVRDARERANEMERKLMREQQARTKEITDAAREAVDEVVAKKKYTLVFPKNALLYADPSLDITKDVLELTNAKLDAKKK